MKSSKVLYWLSALAVMIAGCTNDISSGESNNTNTVVDTVTGEVFADNRIALNATVPGVYSLMYEDSAGGLLPHYASICTLPVEQRGYYEHFIDVNIAPREAEAIGIYDVKGVRQGTIELSTLKPEQYEEPLYSFGLLSDVHLGRTEVYPEEDFANALAHFNARDVELTCICGDITQNGTEAELQLYSSIAAQSNAPVYTTTGNHDCTTAGIDLDCWTKYTGEPLVFERTIERDGKQDHFLFLGMQIWNFTTAYLTSSLSWLEERLEAYKGERCFIITHLFFPERAGNLNNIYPSGNWLRGTQLTMLQNLCDRYLNTVWFSGHSHWEWQLQRYQDRANIYRGYVGNQPTSGWCVHIPSCGAPITSDGTTRVDNVLGTEGAVVEVCENSIYILGIDLRSGKYLPIATYRLDTSLQEVAEKQHHYISASDFVVNQSKAGGTVSDVEGMPHYVEVTFTAKGQGFYVANDTFTPNSSSVSIIVEDVQATSNGEVIDIPPYVGFYGGDYYLASTNAAEVINNSTYHGVQFQTSNSKYGNGPLPLTLRMKVQMEFH